MWYSPKLERVVSVKQIRRTALRASITLPRNFRPEDTELFGIVPVQVASRPEITETQQITPGQITAPSNKEGQWTKTWVVTDKSQEQLNTEAANAAEVQRVQEFTDAQETSGIKKVTIAQAEKFIDNNVTDAGTAKVLKKFALFILK